MADDFPGSDGQRPVTRRVFARRVGGMVLGAPFLSLLDGVALARPPVAQAPPLEQHIDPGVRIRTDNGVEIVVPPVYHEVVTARLTAVVRPGAARRARRAPARSEAHRAGTRRRAERPDRHRRVGSAVLPQPSAPAARRTAIPGLPAGRSPGVPPSRPAGAGARRHGSLCSDPATTVLESNDVVVLLRSDVRSHVTTAREQLFSRMKGILEPTSIRSGFVGAGLPKRLATAAGIPGADAIPDGAQLFLGFTSTQRSALGPTRIANFESLRGVTDQWPNGYFRHGTVMHLSHLFEDLESWYSGDYVLRAWAAFKPGLNPPDGTQTVPEDASVLQTQKEVIDGFASNGIVGHSASLQPLSRLAAATVDHYGTRYKAGTALVQRADFNTLENPFGWTSAKRKDGWRAAACGRTALRLLHGHGEHLRAGEPGDGRQLPGRQRPGPSPARRRAGSEQHPPHDAPPELPRAAAGSPLLPARRARLSRGSNARGRRVLERKSRPVQRLSEAGATDSNPRPPA